MTKRKDVVKRLKCDECNKIVQASNKFFDDRFYYMNCGRNLGIYEALNPLEKVRKNKSEGLKR